MSPLYFFCLLGAKMAFVPTFSPSGWVGNALEKVDFMLAHFFETQKSQTHFYKDKSKVTSYQSLIADAATDGELAANLNSYLNTYLSTQFDNVQMDCQVSGANDDPDNIQLTIQIGCNLTADGVQYTLAHAVELLGTQVQRIYRLDETGSPT